MTALSIFDNQVESDISIVFVHGNSCDKNSFIHQISDEIFQDYRLISMDMPGHGDSIRNAQLYTLDGIRSSISNTINELNLSKVVLVGHSLGGHLLLQSLSKIQNVVGILIFGVPPLTSPPDIGSSFLPHPAIPSFFLPELTDEQVTSLAQSYTSQTDLSQIEESIKNTDGAFRSTLIQDVGLGNLLDEVTILQNTTIPVCIALGEKDPLCNLSYIQSLPNLPLWKQKIHIIKDGSHSPQMDNVNDFNNLLSQYLKDLA
ncbi:MAG: alpha/beta hydrolase [Cytophagales bacterium]|nr:alpha/beta hydrolase [Cytophagales bacterium]